MDFLLGDWVEREDTEAENIRDFFKLFSGLSLSVIVLTYLYNILGQWIGMWWKIIKSAKSNQFQQRIRIPYLRREFPLHVTGASARTNLHEKMLKNLFQCPIEMFEAYPIGRILNRLSCDMFVIDQVSAWIWWLVSQLSNFCLETALLCPETSHGQPHLSVLHHCQLHTGNYWDWNIKSLLLCLLCKMIFFSVQFSSCLQSL